MAAWRFDPAKLDKLNDVARLDDLMPKTMWEVFSAPTADAIAEVGAGTGMFVREFAHLAAPGTTFYAIDAAPEMTSWMHEHLTVPEGINLAIVEADASALPLPDGSLGLLYTINLHHELDDVEAFLREARRVIRPGGRIAIVDWKKEPTPKGPPLSHRIDAPSIAASLAAAGFADATVHDVLRYHAVVTATQP